MARQWSELGGLRRTLARIVYARDSSTPGYVCPGRAERPCGKPIDWTLAWPDPMSRSIDHVRELQDGGDIADPANLASVHLSCNASKGAARMHQRKAEARRERTRRATQVIAIDPASI
ncbi:HNH endonuclease [Catellatospora sp. NPDC049609]|uniref:HNH endonuclease n=1 Tax=Catellatospora sp. NPDC049609 TaxID=3155505 RepID=UPI0034408E70